MNDVDYMIEQASAQLWEEQERVDPEQEALSIATEKAVKLLKEAWQTLCGAVDEDSKHLDLVCSYCNDIEDMIDSLRAERW